MVLKAFWGSLGLLLGALGGFLGGSWEFFGASRWTKEGLQIRLGTLLGLVCSLLAAEDGFGRVLGPSLARFGFSREPPKGCFGIRQTDFDHHTCPSELRYLICSCCCCCCCCCCCVVVLFQTQRMLGSMETQPRLPLSATFGANGRHTKGPAFQVRLRVHAVVCC